MHHLDHFTECQWIGRTTFHKFPKNKGRSSSRTFVWAKTKSWKISCLNQTQVIQMKFFPNVKIHTHHFASTLFSPKLTQLEFSDSQWGGGVRAGGHDCKTSLHSADLEALRPRPGSVSSNPPKVGLGPREAASHCPHLPGPWQGKEGPIAAPTKELFTIIYHTG